MIILFVHIPKTAGTSFLTQMKNVFGDNQVYRFTGNYDDINDQFIANIINSNSSKNRLVAGHFPLALFNSYRHSFRIFTILRDPTQRVLSLYRFFKQRPQTELDRMELSSNFLFEDFISSKNPEIFSQVNNGMCRQLANDGKFSDSAQTAFWEEKFHEEMFDSAMETLMHNEFGLVENMNATNQFIEHSWALPYKLDIYRENTTDPLGIEDQADVLQAINERNKLDIILYSKATQIFHDRLLHLDKLHIEEPTTTISGSIFEAKQNLITNVANISGRQGFYEFEKKR